MANSISFLGPTLVSLVVSGILYGCALVQTYVYFALFPKDSWKFKTLLKLLVAFEMFLQSAHLGFLFLLMWQLEDFEENDLLGPTFAALITIMLSGPIAFCTQAFFVFRLYTFSHKKALPVFCSFLVIAQFVITLAFGIFLRITEPTYIGITNSTPSEKFIAPTLFITICVDTTIAVSMSYYLKANESGFRRTSRVVDRMVFYIMATGTITRIPCKYIRTRFWCHRVWLGLFMIESGLYTNSLLAALNARAKFSHELQHPGSAGGLEVSLSRLGVRQLHTQRDGRTGRWSLYRHGEGGNAGG
ncbi:hypothetical protein BKA82DRAFT_4418811 [Pisolithus tinctorius]|nr:hypothetical protein BKA82DRAFT_4418811 [Pisolithus tinctorius]